MLESGGADTLTAWIEMTEQGLFRCIPVRTVDWATTAGQNVQQYPTYLQVSFVV